MLEKLKRVSGGDYGWRDEDGCAWQSRADYLFMEILPSCGCGDPESIGRYVRDTLKKHVKQSGDFEDYSCWDGNDYDDLPLMFFLNWADHEGYTEHGSSVRCSWMSDKGNELLKDLDEVLT